MLVLMAIIAVWMVVTQAISAPPPHTHTPAFAFGPCPNVPPVANFDLKKYTSDPWYFLYQDDKNNFPFIDDLKCNEKRFKYVEGSQEVEVENYAINAKTKHPVWHNCKGKLAKDTPGIITFSKLNETFPTDTIELRVVDTDYTTYAVGFSCAYDQKSNKRYETAGICGRSKTLPPTKLAEIRTMLKSNGLDKNFVPLDWSDCRARCD